MKKHINLLSLAVIVISLVALAGCSGESYGEEYEAYVPVDGKVSVSASMDYVHDGTAYSGQIKLLFLEDRRVQFDTPHGISVPHEYTRENNVLHIKDAYDTSAIRDVRLVYVDETSFQAEGFGSLTVLSGIPDCSFTVTDEKASVKYNTIVNSDDAETYLVFSGIGSGEPAYYMVEKFVGDASVTDVVIPSTYKGSPVTAIMAGAFDGASYIRSVVIPDSVTGIYEYAFRNCTSLVSVDFPAALTSMYNSVFEGCTALTEAKLPESLATVSENVFSGCTSLRTVILPRNVAHIMRNAFSGCTALESIDLSTENSLLTVDGNAFADCTGLRSVRIEGEQVALLDDSFINCSSLDEVTIVEGFNLFRPLAFRNCTSLKSIVLPSFVTGMYSAEGSSLEYVEVLSADFSIVNETFKSSQLTEINFVNGVNTIGAYAFAGTPMTSITIPSNFENISWDAFAGSNLKEINLYYTSEEADYVLRHDWTLPAGAKMNKILDSGK